MKNSKTIMVYTDIGEVKPELEYICKLYSSLLDANFCLALLDEGDYEANNPCIFYGRVAKDEKKSYVQVCPDRAFWRDYIYRRVPNVELGKINGEEITFTKGQEQSMVLKDKEELAFFDIFALSFYLITRIEEVWGKKTLDQHDRSMFEHSIYNSETIILPIINIYVSWLKSAINRIFKINIQWRNKKMTAVFSHDIDIPYYYGTIRAEISHLIKSIKGNGRYKNIYDIIRMCKSLIGLEKDPYDTFEFIRNIETLHNAPSTWFILMSNDNKWGLDKKKYRRRLKWLISEGCEIGIHPGYHSAFDAMYIKKEKEQVENLANIKIKGARNHFLRFKVPESYSISAEAGLVYDTTLGYAEQEGFRAGIAAPFKPFDINQREIIDIVEMPLVLMDGVLKDYRMFNPEEAIQRIKHLIDIVNEINGMIVFNWHNTFLKIGENEWRHVFESSVEYLAQKKAFFSDCQGAYKKWIDYWK